MRSNDLFFFNDTATTEIYTLSLHDALPIWIVFAFAPQHRALRLQLEQMRTWLEALATQPASARDRKSTRLNSSHANISYAVFCLKKKNLSITARRDANGAVTHFTGVISDAT